MTVTLPDQLWRSEFTRRTAVMNKLVAVSSLIAILLGVGWFIQLLRDPGNPGPLVVAWLPVTFMVALFVWRAGLGWVLKAANVPATWRHDKSRHVTRMVTGLVIRLAAACIVLFHGGPLPVAVFIAGLFLFFAEMVRSIGLRYAEIIAITIAITRSSAESDLVNQAGRA